MMKLRPLSTSFDRFGWLIIGVISAFALGLSAYALANGITDVYPHVFYIPIIAASYYYKKQGFYFSVLLSAAYVLMVILLYPVTTAIFAAMLRAVIFIAIAGIISYLAETLRHEEQIYRTIFHTNRTGMAIADDEGAIIQINPELENISGYTTEEAETNLNLSDLLGEKTVEWIESSCPEYTKEDRAEDFCVFNATLTSKTGEAVPIIFSCSGIPDTNTLSLSITDISELMEAYDKIANSETQLKTIWEHIPAGIVVIEAETHNIVAANPEALHLTGADKEELVGHICHKYVCPAEEGRCPITDLHQTIDNSERVLLTAKGDEIPILKTVSSMTMNKKEYLVETFIDITPQKEAENALLAYIREAALRLKHPVALVKGNLSDIREEVEGETSDTATISTELQVQIKNLSDILASISELDQAITEERKEIPDLFREFLAR